MAARLSAMVVFEFASEAAACSSAKEGFATCPCAVLAME